MMVTPISTDRLSGQRETMVKKNPSRTFLRTCTLVNVERKYADHGLTRRSTWISVSIVNWDLNKNLTDVSYCLNSKRNWKYSLSMSVDLVA